MNEVRIGCYGMSGHQILGKIPDLKRARMTAIGGIDRENFEERKKQSPEAFVDAKYYPDLESMLSSDIDLISLCSDRRADQAEHAVKALRAGKHVLAEKPMACTWKDLEDLRKAAEETGKKLRTMTNHVYDPEFNGMKDVIDAGTLGTLVQVYAMKSYPYHDRRPQDRGVDGGLIMQAGIHAVSFVRYVTGLEFKEVFAQDTGTGNPQKGNLQMAGSISCRMSNGASCVILTNYCNPRGIGFWGNHQLRVFGTKGMIELVDGLNRRMLAVGEQKPVEFQDKHPGKEYPQDLIDCILDASPTLVTQEDSFRNTEVVVRAQESADKGVAIRL